MALRPKKLLSSLKTKTIALFSNYRVTVINAIVTVLLVATVVTVLLTQSSALQRKTTEEGVINIAEMTALEVQTNFLTYYNLINNLAQIMTNYETFDVDQRRLIFDEIMSGVFVSERSLWSIYSIWKPNVLDGMDSVYANASNNGQYNAGFTRERGFIEQRSFNEFEYLLNSNSFNMGLVNQMISEPKPMDSITLTTRQIWTIDIQFPIYKRAIEREMERELVGIIGATINLERLQSQAERAKPYGTGGTLVCASNGEVFAHYNYNMRGRNLREYIEGEEPIFISKEPVAIGNEILESIIERDYKVIRTQDSLIVGYPLTKFEQDSTRYTNQIIPIRWIVVTMVPNTTIFAALNAMIRFSIFFIIGAGALAVLVFFLTSRSLTQHTRNLQRSLEQSSTMHDNLKYGLFLMDEKYIIQGAYSKALERILSLSNLQGRDFIELLSSSVKESEKQGLMDYFDMVLKNAFDKELLESINPINDFSYTSTETGETKSLRTTFTLAGQGRGALYILGTMEDITAEKKLQRQLLEAESLRESEMRALFQVIQIDPRVLNDFVVDAEYEFDRINELLKNKKQVQQEVLVEMYQSVHAVKSNALILNLESFSERLHKLESSVKSLQEEHKDVVPFDDFLSLILEFSDAMKEMDKLKETVSKIQNFRVGSGGEKNQERYVLIETLTRVCNKTQTALDKKVRFVVEVIDEGVLDYAPRRVIKEVLTQLVRNAVYHGIERPEERIPLGKEPEGEIRLSIRCQDNQIVIKLTDNGGGIDFGRIRQAAEELNLVQNEEDANDKNYLLKTIFAPGFSTLDQADFHAGRGMGLSLVKDRIKDLHGNIAVSTAKGKGTTFTITIPLELNVGAADNAS
jgi:two-component system, chemotaxis family, sensor kinase CheA